MPQAPAWLCYGDYVCLSSRAGEERKQRKYILGHSSPLAKLERNEEAASSLDFATLVFCEDPATVPFTHASVSSGPLTFDITTNVHDYWFEILPRTDYDMSAQLNLLKKQLSEAYRRLKMLNERKEQLAALLLSTHNPTTDQDGVVLNVQDGKVERSGIEMLPMNSRRNSMFASSRGRRFSVQDPAILQNDIDGQIELIRTIEQRVLDFESKAAIEEQGNEETIMRASGDALNFGSVIQLRHVNSKRFLSVTKEADRAMELSAKGRMGSLFVLERASGGVTAGTIKVPADEGVRIFLRSVASDAQYVRIESGTIVTELKFPLNLDIELDGIYSADDCFQLGIGPPAVGDDRVEWTIERVKCVNSDSLQSNQADSDDDEDSGVKASQVLSGCQIIRLFHRFSDSYLCAAANKIDHGTVFYSHRSECDTSKGPGSAANSYWLVIDGDNDLADSGEDIESDSPVILQHVISGMVLVAVRHLPATPDVGSKATNHEDFLSDDDENVDALIAEEKLVKRTRNALSRSIDSFLKAITEVESFCKHDIGSSGYALHDFELTVTQGVPPQFTVCNSETDGSNHVKLWIQAERIRVVSLLEDVSISFLKQEDLTSEAILAKSQEIEYEISRWFNTPVFERGSCAFSAHRAVELITQNLADSDQLGRDDNSQSGLSQNWMSVKRRVSQIADNRSRESGEQQGRRSSQVGDNLSKRGADDRKAALSDAPSQSVFPSKVRHVSNPLTDLAELINEFSLQLRAKNSRVTQSPDDHLWTFHVMSPKRILKFRKILDEDPCIRLTAPFLLACRWNFCTKHEKVKIKDESHAVMANSLFGIEVKDASESLFLLGRESFVETQSRQSPGVFSGSSQSLTGAHHSKAVDKKGVSMITFGLNAGRGLDSQEQSDMIMQLFNVEFVSAKSSDSIKKGAQVTSIVRNFCLLLKDVLGKQDLEYYFAFLRRYSSRLIEALDFISRSCVVGGFDKDADGLLELEPHSQGQSFFGSLGIIDIIFDVVQIFTEQLGWQHKDNPPFFLNWNVRSHWTPFLHETLLAISATTSLFPSSKADEFWKLWIQKKNTNGEPWSDSNMTTSEADLTPETLEEMGFPSRNEGKHSASGVAHMLFRFFSQTRSIQQCSWIECYEEFGGKSPLEIVNEIMGKNFPTIDISKKVNAVERHFNRLHGSQSDNEDKSSMNSDKVMQLQETLQHSMKGSRFSVFFNKHLRLHRHDDSNVPAGFFPITIMISQDIAANCRRHLDKDHGKVVIPPGIQTIYVTEHGVFQCFVQCCVVESARSLVLSALHDRQSTVFINSDMLVPDASVEVIKSLWQESQQNLACVLKSIALDPENHDSPWNHLPVFFNLRDESRFADARFILIEIIRQALTCFGVMSHKCQANKAQFSCSQMYYIIKNVFPPSPVHLLPTLPFLIFLAENNSQMIDRMFSDAIYSTLFSIFDSLRNSTSKLFAALLTNQDGSVDFFHQCRVLEYVFKKPRQESGIIIVPRVWTSTENGNIVSCRQFLDRKFALLKKHDKPYPKDHPFAFIKPPSWALDADGQRRSYIEPWDTLTGIVRRDASDFRSHLYGEYCPYGSLMLHFFESENDLRDFNYWKSIRDIEDEWKAVHKHSSSKDVVERKELELKRDWWYSTMIYSIQFLFNCYSLVAKLCENRNMVAREFFCGSSKLKKEEFFIQTWGSRPQNPIVRHEGIDINDPQTHKSIIRFNNDGLSTVAAVTCIKPLNPSCAYEVAFPSRSFMYYEVSIESIQDAENAVLAIGWTIADRERNADEPSDGTGVGYPSHSWSIDGIRQVTYANATHILRPSMESFLFDLEKRMKTADEKRVKLLKQDSAVKQNIDKIKEAEHDCRIIAFQVKNKRDILDQLNAQIMATESRLRFALQTLGKVENSIRIRDLTEQELIIELDKKLPNAVVDRGILCFHNSGTLFGGANLTSEMKPSMAIDQHGRSAIPPSTRWKEKSVIGVWIDSDSREIGIVQDGVNDRCKHAVFKYEDYAFLDSNPNVNVTWREHNIVPCISGRAVTIKVNLGLREGGKNNEFKFFDRESVNFHCNKLFDTSFKKIKCIQGGTFHTDEPHTLKENEFICIQFPSQKYEMPSVCSLQERRPYRVKVLSLTSFSLRDVVPNKCYQTATVVHPRIFVREKVSFATFEPCVLVHGQKAVDVTARWNDIFEKEKIREIALTEVVYENGSKRPIKFGLADIFCDPITGLHLFQDVSCELKTYPTYNVSDVPVSQCNFSYFRCQGFVAPSQEGMYSQVVPNFAFSDGTPVIPGYQSLLDLVFFSKLPCSFRASCVQVLRTAYIDQEPWFVTPPVNIFRSDRTHNQAAAAAPGGGSYDLEEFIGYGYVHEQSKFGDIWSLSAYSEADIRLFDDLYCAACWEMETSFGQNPESHIKDFGDKNWNEKTLEKRKTFLLHGYKSPPGVFQLSTRDIVIFWGRAISQLMEQKMKKKVFLEKNQDSKVFCKELIDCVMVTLKFEFNESWIGIISIRSKVIQLIQQCVLSYLKEVGVAQEIADRKKAEDRDQKVQNAAEHSAQSSLAQNQEATSIFSTSWKTVLSFFSRNETPSPTSSSFTSSKHFVEHIALRKAERKHQSYNSRIPQEILRHSNFVNVQSLQLLATTVEGSRSTSIQSLIHDIQRYELFASKKGNPNRTFTFVDFERKWSEPPSPQTQIEQPYANASHKQLKKIFQEASGDLLLGLCMLLDVSWHIMIDDKITQFVNLCCNYSRSSNRTSQSLFLDSVPGDSVPQEPQNQPSDEECIISWFKNELIGHDEVNCEWLDENGLFRAEQVNFFEVFLNLASIPKPALCNMASKLSIQLHSFPKNLFMYLQQTEVLCQEDSELFKQLEDKLKSLVSTQFCLQHAIIACFTSTLLILLQRISKSLFHLGLYDEYLQWHNVPNHVSRSLGEAWLSVEYCIALLSTKADYKKSISHMTSWLSPIVCRILIPDKKNHEMYERGICLINEFGGPPEWEESLEYVQMLQLAFSDTTYCAESERNFRLSDESDYLIISPRLQADQNGKVGCSWTELRIHCDAKRGSGPLSSVLPARKTYTCHVCREPGNGFCWASSDGTTQSICCVHPKCVLENSMAGPIKCLRGESSRPSFPTALFERFRTLFASSKMIHDTKNAWEQQEFVVSIVDRHDANVFLDAFNQTIHDEHTKLSKIKMNMSRIGIFDEIIQILKIPLPQYFNRLDAKNHNAKMQRRMQIRRINFRYENVSATEEKTIIAENLFHRMFHFLALAAKDSWQIQNLLQNEIPFFLYRALRTSPSQATGIFQCIKNIMSGRVDLISNFSIKLLEETTLSALEAQFPAKLLLLRTFLVQDAKHFPINQLIVLDICLPSTIANSGQCFFTLDSDFPADFRKASTFEKWRTRLLSSYPASFLDKNIACHGEIPWKKSENWRHLLRVSSDIVHGGHFAESQSCASAFHLAVIGILKDTALKNIDTRRKLVDRLPLLHILNVVNTVCSTLYHRMWGYSFGQRVSVLNIAESDELKTWNIPKDPRLTFLNFEFIQNSVGQITKLFMFPINGILKFIKGYIELALEAHLFIDIDVHDVSRRSLDGLPLAVDSDGVFGFISWLNVLLKCIMNLFLVTQNDGEIGLRHDLLHSSTKPDINGSPRGNVSSIKPFETLEIDWFRIFGDMSCDQFDSQSFHGLMSVTFYELWGNLYGPEANFETKKSQSKKMSDKDSYVSKKRDLNNSAGFCRPCWLTPISHKHFTERSRFLLALATSCTIEDSVPYDWYEGSEISASILGAFQASSTLGYPSSSPNLRPSTDDVKKGLMFERLVELMIQKLHFQFLEADGRLHEITACDVLAMIMNHPTSVYNQYQQFFVEESDVFASCLNKFFHHSWPNILAQEQKGKAAAMLIERKITHWNIILAFDPSSSSFAEIKQNFSTTQIPVIKRCLVFALVYNWGGWKGFGRAIRSSQLNEMMDAVSEALKNICKVSIEVFPTFVQRLFRMYESPKINSNVATEFQTTGNLFLGIYEVLSNNQSSTISLICNAKETITSSPKTCLKYLRQIGDSLYRRDPSTWRTMESFSQIPVDTSGALHESGIVSNHRNASIDHTDNLFLSPISGVSEAIKSESLSQLVLNMGPVKEIIESTLEHNPKQLLFRFLGIGDIDSSRTSDRSCFFGKSAITNSTNRELFPQHLHKMVYNVIGVIGSFNSLLRGEESNALILSSLTTIVQVIYAGACTNMAECKNQLSKYSAFQPVLEQQDSESLFARVNHLQECLLGLQWRPFNEMDYPKGRLQRDSSELHQNLIPVRDSSMKVALRTIQYLAQLTIPSSPTLEIRIEALRALICLLDSCSVAVLDQLFGEMHIIQSSANTFAVSLAHNLREYEHFSDRDDILVAGFCEFQAFYNSDTFHDHYAGNSQDEFVRHIIGIELQDSLADPNRTPTCIKKTYDRFCSEGYDICMHSLRLIEKMCVLSGKKTRSPYLSGQSFLEIQPNSDPAMVVNFQLVIISLGSEIASRFRIGGGNVFDLRVLSQIFKALNCIIFGQSPLKIKSILVADTYVLVNKTVSGLSQRIDNIENHYFPEIHPIHVFESLLKFLMTLLLSDTDGTSSKALGKGVSWMNLFSLVHQVHAASLKFSTNTGLVAHKSQSRISSQEYCAVANRIGDTAFILFSCMKRQDIAKCALLDKEWSRANLEAVAVDARKRVSCVEIIRYPGFPELCFFPNPETLDVVNENAQRTLLCVEESRQLSLRKNLVLCERMRVSTNATTALGPQFLKKIRNLPLLLTTFINILLLAWLNLPIDVSQAESGWTWPQQKMSWELFFSENGTYSYDVLEDKILPNILPLFISEDSPNGLVYKRAVNMTFLVLTIFNIACCFVLLIGWLWFESGAAVYEYLLASAYEQFISPMNQSRKKVSLEELQQQASGKNFLHVLKLPAFWGFIMMFGASLCILLISPLFSTLFVCDGFRFDGIAYIFGAFILKAKEFATLGYLAASIIFLNAIIGLVFFWDLFEKGEGGSTECSTLFQCTLSFIVQGIGGISDFFTKPKDTIHGAPDQFGSDRPGSFRQIISLLWQLIYFIVVPTCLVSTVTGVIVDSFGDARQKQVDWKEKMRSECFVCGISAAEFRDANLAGNLPDEAIVTFQDHVNSEHCVKDYFKLFMRLKNVQNPDILTAQEHYVLHKMNSLDETFFPIDQSISLNVMRKLSDTTEQSEARLNAIEREIGNVRTLIQERISQASASLQDHCDAKFEQVFQMLRSLQTLDDEFGAIGNS